MIHTPCLVDDAQGLNRDRGIHMAETSPLMCCMLGLNVNRLNKHTYSAEWN